MSLETTMEELFIPPISKSRKPKAGSNQLSKIYYRKAAASKKTAFKSSPFGWAFGFWCQKPKPKAQPNAPLVYVVTDVLAYKPNMYYFPN